MNKVVLTVALATATFAHSNASVDTYVNLATVATGALCYSQYSRVGNQIEQIESQLQGAYHTAFFRQGASSDDLAQTMSQIQVSEDILANLKRQQNLYRLLVCMHLMYYSYATGQWTSRPQENK